MFESNPFQSSKEVGKKVSFCDLVGTFCSSQLVLKRAAVASLIDGFYLSMAVKGPCVDSKTRMGVFKVCADRSQGRSFC